MDCIKLNNNINECATTNPFRRWDEVGYILPYEDVTNVVFNGMNVKFDTIGTAFSVRDRRLNPFSGSGSEFVQGDMGSVSWTERVNFPALANSVDNSTIANAIANGGRVVVILKQVDYESDGKGKYQVFGIDGGLRIDTMPFDPYADAAWNVTLIAEKMSRPAVYLWDTDEATTDAKWELITQYEYITGLSLADGSVTPKVVYLQVDSDKECKVILPNSTTLTSTAGIINDIWRGAAGAVTLLVDKTSQKVYFGDYDNSAAIISDYIGDLYTIFNGSIQVYSCTSLTSVSAPNATYLYCTGCTSLTSVSAPNATILEFSDCTSLTSVSAPSATDLYCYGCTSLTSISAPSATYLNCSSCTSLTSISAPNVIDLYCYDCTSLTSISAPSATDLYCYGCTSLTSISAPSATYLNCSSCTSLTSVSAPNATDLNCSSCTSLTSLSAPNVIDLYCYGCTSLTSISAPSATDLNCSYCTSLTSVSAPNAIDLNCYGCALTSVSIAAQLAATIVNLEYLSMVTFDFSDGTNAAYSTWSAQAKADAQTITTAGGTVTYNS